MNTAILIQSLKQMWGLIVIEYKYQGRLPNIENYHCRVKYSLPFDGEWVVVNGGITQDFSHSWELPTQRYAYDFIRLDKSGKSFNGKETETSSFYCYGQDILAPADGIVVEVCKGNPNSKINRNRDASCAARDIRGNYLLIYHAEREYSLLAHLKPDSIIVSEGQSVRRGEKIAQCGNSGNSTEPHLHFHIQSGKSFYSSLGLPIEFEDITVKETKNYEQFDNREVPQNYETIYPPYITRGQTVCNKNTKIKASRVSQPST